MSSKWMEWVAFAIAVGGIALYQSDVHVALRALGYVCILVGGLTEAVLTVRGYLRKRSGARGR